MIVKSTYTVSKNYGLDRYHCTDFKLFGFILIYRAKVNIK